MLNKLYSNGVLCLIRVAYSALNDTIFSIELFCLCCVSCIALLKIQSCTPYYTMMIMRSFLANKYHGVKLIVVIVMLVPTAMTQC